MWWRASPGIFPLAELANRSDGGIASELNGIADVLAITALQLSVGLPATC